MIGSQIIKDKVDIEYVKKDLINYKELKLEYRGSKDGFKGADFFRKCKNKQNTLMIVKTTEGDILGGYKNECALERRTWVLE